MRPGARLRAGGVLAGVDDLEVLAHEDLELLAGARGDVRLVGSGGVAVGLRAHDGRAGVLGQHGRLDLLLGVAGQRGLARAGPAAARAVPVAVATKALSTSTTFSVPSEVFTCAWYGVLYGPPASVRRTVAPGTFWSAAALTFAAVVPESASRCGFVDDADLLSVAPAIAAPPRASAPSMATAAVALRMVGSMVRVPPLVGVLPMLSPPLANPPRAGSEFPESQAGRARKMRAGLR